MLDPTTLRTALRDPRVRAVFDGRAWISGHPTGSVWMTPPLVDAGCGIAGYRENLLAPLLRAPRAIAALLQQSGLGAVRVSASSWAEHWNFRAVCATDGVGVQVVGGGPSLVDEEPTSERQRWVRTEHDLASAVGLAAAEGVGWLPVQTTDTSFARRVADTARENGLRIALRGGSDASATLGPGDLYAGLPHLVRSTMRDSPVRVLTAWAGPDGDRAADTAASLLDRGVLITTELLNLRRTVFVRESLDTPFLEENEPILPHVRWLLQMRRGTGYLGGRSALAEHAGLREPTRAEARMAEAGWQRLLRVAADLAGRPGLLPASTSPQLTQLPGFALKEELSLLLQHGVVMEVLLARSTSTDLIGGTPWAPGLVLVSSTDPGEPRFLASLRPRTQERSDKADRSLLPAGT